jgi:AraC-like DNA-binding protein
VSAVTLVDSYTEYAPSPRLARWISCTWIRGVQRGGDRKTVTPDGCADIIVPSDGEPFIAGPDTGPQFAELRRGHLVGVRFAVGAAGALLGIPASELRDQRVLLSDVWRRDMGEVLDALGSASSLSERRIALQSIVARRSSGAAIADRLVLEAVKRLSRPEGRVAALSGDLGVGERQLLRRFDAAVGYGPKVLDRVLRFQRLLAAFGAAPERPLSTFAQAAGYADQAHMNRECVRLAGATPKALYERTRLGRRP